MSETRLMYNDEDITLDVILKIEHTCRLIAAAQQITFDEAYERFVNTATYEALQKPHTLMWAESAEYIVDRYFDERDPARLSQQT